MVDRSKAVTEVTGWRRYQEGKAYLKEYSGLAKWVQEVDAGVVQAFERLEASTLELTQGNVRRLQHQPSRNPPSPTACLREAESVTDTFPLTGVKHTTNGTQLIRKCE